MNLGEFLSHEAGQKRRAWLDSLFAPIENAQGFDRIATIGDMLNPVSDIGRAGVSARTVFDPNATTNERIGATGAMLTDMASVLAPGVATDLAARAGGKTSGDAARAITEALAGFSAPADDAVTRFAAADAGSVKLPYGIEHRPMTVDGGAATLDDLTPSFGEDIYGREALQYFGSGDPRERSVLRTLQGLRGKPDAEVTIYRGVPDGVDNINPGDWVTLDPSAAADYGNVVSMKVPARDVTSWADSLLEFGYYPKKIGADDVAKRGDEILALVKSDPASVTDEMLDMGDPVLNARLNQYLFNNYDLPMDAQSRMARAGEMRFDVGTPLYHGTKSDIRAINTGRRGTYFTDDPKIADIYSGSEGNSIRSQIADADPNTIPAFSAGNQISYSDLGPDGSHGWLSDNYAAELGYDGSDVVAGARPKAMDARAIEDGFRTAKMTEMLDLGGVQTQWRVLDPTAIRSRFARFDPRLAHLRNLSAGAAGTALLGDYLTPDQREAELRAYLGM